MNPLTAHEQINAVKALYEQINLLVNIDSWEEPDNWEGIENLLLKRNQAIEIAFTPSLPNEEHIYARKLFEEIRQQDKMLLDKAKQLQEKTGKHIIDISRGKSSVASYLDN